jgi:heme/copper-type cytochrome/quinol oxidase subunit 4
MQDLKHKILLALTALTIIAEIASIILWTANPTIPLGQARITLAVDYTIAVANAAVFAVLNLVAFMWIKRRNKNGPLFLITISIINRLISHPIFIGGAHLVFITWTLLLIIFAYLDYRKLSKQK